MTELEDDTARKGAVASFRLILFFAGDEINSRAARQNLDDLCLEDLDGRCEIRYVDVLEDFEEAVKHNVLVTPTLLICEPRPEVAIIGNLSDRARVLKALGIAGD